MKKSIASAALLASAASSFALIAPPTPTPSAARQVQVGDMVPSGAGVQAAPGFYCLGLYEDQDGSKMLSSCDASYQNQAHGLEVNEQGCTVNQAALRITKNIQINACPSYAQL